MSEERKERARKLLSDLDALLGKPIRTGPVAEAAYEMILAALVSPPTKPAVKEDDDLARLIETRLLGVHHDDQDLYLEDHDWQRIIAALRASPPAKPAPADGWQPIETAPKDGSKFIGLLKDGRAATMNYRNSVKGWKQKENGGWVADGYHLVLCEEDSDSICPRDATHWMPFPALSTAQGEGA